MKPKGLLKTAVTVRSLKNLQHHLAVVGNHRDALVIGEEADLYIDAIACQYLDIDELPDTVAGNLVRELSFEAVFSDSESQDHELIDLLIEAAEEGSSAVQALREAKTKLPNLREVTRVLEE